MKRMRRKKKERRKISGENWHKIQFSLLIVSVKDIFFFKLKKMECYLK